MRIDDIDTPRVVIGADKSIFNTLKNHGLEWDGEVDYQSQHLSEYQNIIDKLVKTKKVYPCFCSRKTLLAAPSPVYSGTCLHAPKQNLPYSLRVKSKQISTSFNDELQGYQDTDYVKQHGDFIIKRKDNITAYQLAVVIDDQRNNITHIVRGYDLLDSTPKQIFLQKTLGYRSPQYCHFPVIIDQYGEKLSKQKYAQAVTSESPQNTLFLLLELLRQKPPKILKTASIKEIINWGIEHWQTEPLKKIRAINKQIN